MYSYIYLLFKSKNAFLIQHRKAQQYNPLRKIGDYGGCASSYPRMQVQAYAAAI
jgi:hypothetical protein